MAAPIQGQLLVAPRAVPQSLPSRSGRSRRRSNIAAAGLRGWQIQITAADQFASDLLPVIDAVRRTGATTLEAITRALNDRGIRPARGTRWYASSVANLLNRANKLAEAL